MDTKGCGTLKSSEGGRLSDSVYRTVLESIPVPTVDFIPVRIFPGKRREFLLGKRTEEPYRGQWFVTGGRINRFERMENAVRRQAKRELGIQPRKCDIRFIGCLDVWNPPKMGVRWHSIWHFHIVVVPAKAKIVPNRENAEVRWFDTINPRWPAPVQRALQMAGFKEGK